ncbi:GvpL/GvpF family gas vesicle protein [Leptolyngbya sp. AN02str]|uniref:gas vesicle protein GvpF n=1 Tax=Leptolyngbya sp. AN02str TaxID=3423363 RepID=UPI003D3216A9
MTNGLYLYGIFPHPGPQQLDLEGLDNQPVHTQDLDGFVFLYSEAKQKKYLSSRKNLLGHERVLEGAMEHGYRTLLPLQFGLIVDDWSSVQAQLTHPQGEALQSLFHKLEGHREVSVKLFWEQDQELELLMQQHEALRTERDRLEGKALSMDEVVKIGQAIERSLEDRKQQIIQEFRATLNPLATDVIENDSMTPAMIYNAAYLIPWNEEATFGRQVEALDAQFEGRLKIRYNNFTAPFNFARLN